MEATAVSSRRDFLLAAGLGTVATMVVAGTQGRSGDERTEVAAKAVDGYRASPHVMKYYRTAEI